MSGPPLKILEIGSQFIVTDDHRAWEANRQNKDFRLQIVNYHVCLIPITGSPAPR